MRFYKIKIDSKYFPLELNADNPTAPTIQFDFRQYAGAELSNAYLKIYNLPFYFYQELNALKNKKIEVYGGIGLTPITKKLGITIVGNNLIGFGYITNAIANYEGTSTSLTLQINPSPLDSTNEGIIYNVIAGDDVILAIVTVLKNLYSEAVVANDSEAVVANDSEAVVIYNYFQLVDIANKHGLVIYKTLKGFKVAKKDLPQVENIVVIKAEDLIAQPRYLNANTIQLDLFLRGDIQIGSKISIPNSIFVSTIGVENKFSTLIPQSIIKGDFIVTYISHVGKSNSQNASEWATTIQGVKSNAV